MCKAKLARAGVVIRPQMLDIAPRRLRPTK